MPRDSNLEADWIGKPPDYYDEEETEFDEDFVYDSLRDMQLEEAIDELNRKENGSV